MEGSSLPPILPVYMLSRMSHQRQAIGAAKMSKSIIERETSTRPWICARAMEMAGAALAVGDAATSTRVPRSSLCVLLCPFLGRSNSLGLVLLPRLSNVVGERVVWVRGAKKGLDGEKDGPDLKRR